MLRRVGPASGACPVSSSRLVAVRRRAGARTGLRTPLVR